jgi:hypothetical protein
MKKAKIILLVDRLGWAYSTKAEALIKNYNGTELEFKMVSSKASKEKLIDAFNWADRYVFFGFQNFRRCSIKSGCTPDKALVSVASHESWDKKKTQPTNQVLPDKEIISYLSTFKSVSAVSLRLVNLFKKAGLDIYYTPNGVPTEVFTPNFTLNNPIICGYAGRDRDDKKGNRSIIEPSVAQCYIPLNQAVCDFKLEKRQKTRGKNYLDYSFMPNFYKNIDIYLCASREEGSCRSILEAMASGCAIISTDSGEIHQLINNNNDGGFIVDRNIKSFVTAINQLKKDKNLLTQMKERNVKKIQEFDWSNISHYWYKWILDSL